MDLGELVVGAGELIEAFGFAVQPSRSALRHGFIPDEDPHTPEIALRLLKGRRSAASQRHANSGFNTAATARRTLAAPPPSVTTAECRQHRMGGERSGDVH